MQTRETRYHPQPSRNLFGLIPVSLRQSVLYALAIFLSKGVGFLMIPVFTHYLEPADYGRLDILQTLADLLSIVLILGMSEALFKFHGQAGDEDEKARVGANIFGLVLVMCVLSTVILQIAAPLVAKLLPADITIWQARFLLMSLSVSAVLLIPLCVFRMKERAGAYFIASSGRVMAQAVLAFAFLYAGYGVTGVMAAGAAVALFMALILTVQFIRRYGVGFDFALWRKFLFYGSPLILTGLAGFVLGSFDRWFLAASVGAAEMAIYALAAKFGLLTALLLQPFDLWWSPKRFAVLNEGRGEEKCAKAISIGLVCVVLSIIAISSGAPLAILMMTPEAYHGAMVYVPALSLLAGLHMATHFMNIGIYNVKVTKWPAFIDMVAAVLAIFGYFIFIPIMAAWGAVLATAIALGVRFIATVMLSQKLTNLPYRFGALIGLAVMAVLSAGLLSIGFDLITHMAVGFICTVSVIMYAWMVGLLSSYQAMKEGSVSCPS